MSSRPFSRKVAVLVVFAILALPRPGLLEQIWSFLTGAWSESGCHIDPSGGCAPEPTPTMDEGCRIDPSGGCSA